MQLFIHFLEIRSDKSKSVIHFQVSSWLRNLKGQPYENVVGISKNLNLWGVFSSDDATYRNGLYKTLGESIKTVPSSDRLKLATQ